MTIFNTWKKEWQIDEDKYTSEVAKLLNASYFSDFADHSDDIALFINPFNFQSEGPTTYIEEKLQLEIIDLKC